ncbi:hexapaptide repeat-containing transferase [Rivularia sp. IAM M-261]|nr:hexapaptide repeat-containing transferase [Rivularia sp. IAM M-261]
MGFMIYHNQTIIERLKELVLTNLFGKIPTHCLGLEIRNFIYKSLFKRIDNSVYIEEGAYFFGTRCIEIGKFVHIFKEVCIDGRGIDNHIDIRDGVILNKGVNIRALDATDIYIDERTFIGNDVYVIGLGNIKIGQDCVIGDNSGIFASRNIFNNINQNIPNNDMTRKGIVIEDNCWLGHGVTILNGVTIGKGSIIGANSVVAEDIPPYSNVAGIPARVIKSKQKD